MSVEAYADTLPKGERENAIRHLQSSSRIGGERQPFYAYVESRVAIGWKVKKYAKRGMMFVSPTGRETTNLQGLGRYGMGYASFLSPKPRTAAKKAK